MSSPTGDAATLKRGIEALQALRKRAAEMAIEKFEAYPKQMAVVEAGKENQIRGFFACNGGGKALPNSEPVLTPGGWKSMGRIKEGDRVCVPDGGDAEVIGVYPQGVKPIYEIEFSDGSRCRSTLDHIWTVDDFESRFRKGITRNMKLQEIIDIDGETPRPCRRVTVPVVKPLAMKHQELPIHPYVLGVLLGDGCITQGVKLCCADPEIIDKIAPLVPVPIRRGAGKYEWYLTNGASGGTIKNPLKESLRSLNILGTRAQYKSIPDLYMTAGPDDRHELLKGLMDTDGTADTRGRCSFMSTSEALADGVAFLARSLGQVCSVRRTTKHVHYKGRRVECECYNVGILKPTIPVFSLTRKLKRQRLWPKTHQRVMRRFRHVGEEESTCIVVDHPGHLFITSGVTPTHNSDLGAIETACHLTGKYPAWWKGHRFTHPINSWAVGTTNETTRDNCQRKLIGVDMDHPGNGWLSPDDIVSMTRRSGVADSVDTLGIKHVSGGISYLTFKANDQKQRAFMGPRLHWIWGDEEMDKPVLDELIFRMVGVPDARMLITFTPLQGMTETVMFLYESDQIDGVWTITMSMNECRHDDGRTHITEAFKNRLVQMYRNEPHVLEARMSGIPTKGSGLIYPFNHKDIFIRRFPLEPWWPRIGGIDPGYAHPTAIGAFALDPDAGVVYGYKLHYAPRMTVEQHVKVIESWGDIQFVSDPAALQSDKGSGIAILDQYRKLLEGANWEQHRDARVISADYSKVAMGIAKTRQMLEDGKLFFFDIPEFDPLKKELMLYRYDETTGRPVKKLDDALDMVRYTMNSLDLAKTLGYFNKLYRNDGMPGHTLEQWTPPVGSPGY